MSPPLSRETLLQYGKCCGHKCKNCPYTPKHKAALLATADMIAGLGAWLYSWLPLWLRPRYILDMRQRAGQWRAIRAAHLEKEPACVACGRTANLEVHHVIPVSFDETKQLDPENLITLCAHPCHIVFGHCMSYHCYNKDVRKMAADYRKAVAKRKCLKPHEFWRPK